SCWSPPVCYSLIPRPPRSPLFPYTTLFRSGIADHVPGSVDREPPRRAAAADRAKVRHRAIGVQKCVCVGGCIRVTADLTTSVDGDRKSTRLNSSHVSISYAVFCLKKKNSYT